MTDVPIEDEEAVEEPETPAEPDPAPEAPAAEPEPETPSEAPPAASGRVFWMDADGNEFFYGPGETVPDGAVPA